MMNPIIKGRPPGYSPRRSERLQQKLVKGQIKPLSVIGIILMIMGVALAALADVPYNITNVNQTNGLYFEEVGKMAISISKWSITNRLDLNQLWIEQENLKNITSQLNETCYTAYDKDYCMHTMKPFYHQIESIEAERDIISIFGHRNSSRIKRGLFDGVGIVAN